MKRNALKWLALILMAAALFSFGGCHGSDDFLPPADVELNNLSSVYIDEFHLTPVNSSTWGPNLLSTALPPGDFAVFRDITSRVYDAKIVYYGTYSDYFAYAYNIDLFPNDYYVLNVYDSSFSGSLEITNGAIGVNIVEVYVVPATATTWGTNQISSPVPPGGVIHLTDFDPGLYAVRVVWSDLVVTDYSNQSISSLALTTLTVN